MTWGCIHWYSWKILCSQINSQTNNAHKVLTRTITHVIFNSGLIAKKTCTALWGYIFKIFKHILYFKMTWFDNFLYSRWQWWQSILVLFIQSKPLKCSCFSLDLSGWIHSMPQKPNLFPFIISNNSLYIGSISTLWAMTKKRNKS